jgi:hypothetical protein
MINVGLIRLLCNSAVFGPTVARQSRAKQMLITALNGSIPKQMDGSHFETIAED